MIEILGSRGTTAESLKAFKANIKKDGIDFIILVSYAMSDRGEPQSHGFIIPRYNSTDITIITDGFASGYSGEGPRGLIECMKLIPYGMLVFNLAVKEWKAREIFNGEMSILELVSMYRDMRALSVYWSHQDASDIIKVESGNTMLIRQDKGTAEASLAPVLRPRGPNLEPSLSRPL